MAKFGVIPIGRTSVTYHIPEAEALSRISEGRAVRVSKKVIRMSGVKRILCRYSGPMPPAEVPGVIFVPPKSISRLPSECAKAAENV